MVELYFGNIASITNQPKTATYTLASASIPRLMIARLTEFSAFRQAITQILVARQPTIVRTLDYISGYDGGDHSDHYTTARITQEIVAANLPSAKFSGYVPPSL